MVCKDLSKTYNEIIKLPDAIILWHYLNAMELQKNEAEKEKDLLKYNTFLQRPDIYAKLEQFEKNKTENPLFVEKEEVLANGQVVVAADMSSEEFGEIIRRRNKLTENSIKILEVQGGDEVYTNQEIASNLNIDLNDYDYSDNPIKVEKRK